MQNLTAKTTADTSDMAAWDKPMADMARIEEEHKKKMIEKAIRLINGPL